MTKRSKKNEVTSLKPSELPTKTTPAKENSETGADPAASSNDESVVTSGARGAAVGGALAGWLGATLGGMLGLSGEGKNRKKNSWY